MILHTLILNLLIKSIGISAYDFVIICEWNYTILLRTFFFLMIVVFITLFVIFLF